MRALPSPETRGRHPGHPDETPGTTCHLYTRHAQRGHRRLGETPLRVEVVRRVGTEGPSSGSNRSDPGPSPPGTRDVKDPGANVVPQVPCDVTCPLPNPPLTLRVRAVEDPGRPTSSETERTWTWAGG